MDEERAARQASIEMARKAALQAKDRANAARWNLDVAIFLISILAILIILLFEGIEAPIAGPIALFGLVMVWLIGWRRARQLYPRFYDEELSRLRYQAKRNAEEASPREKVKAIEETIEEAIQKSFIEKGY